MTDPRDSHRQPDPDRNIGVQREREDPRTPRWVKVFGMIALILVLLFVVLHLAGAGLRGHAPAGRTSPSGATQHETQQP